MSILKYYDDLNRFIKLIQVMDRSGKEIRFEEGIEKAIGIILQQHSKNKNLMFIGNGGSAAIASHMAVDFWKSGRIKAFAFNDTSLLTCISNDYGYEQVFVKPIEIFAEAGDVLIAISSSGKSKNILNGVGTAAAKECHIITLSGFENDNPLIKREI